MKHSKIKALRKFVGGYSSERRQALGLSPRLSKGGQRQGKGVTPYGK